MRTAFELLVAVVLFIVYPLTASLTLIGLVAVVRPDRFEPMAAGWTYLGLLAVALYVAYLAFKSLADDLHRRWPRKPRH
jgi:hypothetical protein